MDIHALVAAAPVDHPLRTNGRAYLDGFIQAVTTVHGAGRLAKVLSERFYIGRSNGYTFDRFLQSASELSVQNHLATRAFTSDFGVDKKLHGLTDVDAFLKSGSVRVSVEVKCAVEQATEAGAFVVRTAGRIPSHADRIADIEKLIARGDPSKRVVVAKNKDNTLKDFLKSAHQKFSPSAGMSDLNVVFVACDGPQNLDEWRRYLVAREGCFTPESFHTPSEFALVDVAVLSNLKYWHAHAAASHDWTLKDVLLLPFRNPVVRQMCVSTTITQGLEVFDHHMERFETYRRPVDPRFCDDDVRDCNKVLGFVHGDGEGALTAIERARYFPTLG